MKVIIAGLRGFNDYDLFKSELEKIIHNNARVLFFRMLI